MPLSGDQACSYLSKFVAAEVTTTVRSIPVEIPLGRREGMPKPCAANCDNLRTIPRYALVEKISELAPARIPEAKRAVGYALGWDELIDA